MLRIHYWTESTSWEWKTAQIKIKSEPQAPTDEKKSVDLRGEAKDEKTRLFYTPLTPNKFKKRTSHGFNAVTFTAYQMMLVDSSRCYIWKYIRYWISLVPASRERVGKRGKRERQRVRGGGGGWRVVHRCSRLVAEYSLLIYSALAFCSTVAWTAGGMCVSKVRRGGGRLGPSERMVIIFTFRWLNLRDTVESNPTISLMWMLRVTVWRKGVGKKGGGGI